MRISNDQYKTIHKLQRDMGLDDEAYRQMLWDNFSVRSSTELRTSIRADELIRVMRAKLGASPYGSGKFKYEHLGNRPGKATPGQLRKIEAMWEEVSIHRDQQGRDKALQDFLVHRFGVLGIFGLERDQVQKVIKALDVMITQKRAPATKKAKQAQQPKEEAELACKHCGCTETTPCLMPNGQGCAWVEGLANVCTGCIRFERGGSHEVHG